MCSSMSYPCRWMFQWSPVVTTIVTCWPWFTSSRSTVDGPSAGTLTLKVGLAGAVSVGVVSPEPVSVGAVVSAGSVGVSSVDVATEVVADAFEAESSSPPRRTRKRTTAATTTAAPMPIRHAFCTGVSMATAVRGLRQSRRSGRGSR